MIRDIPEPQKWDGACGPGALFALLGGNGPGEHKVGLRETGWTRRSAVSVRDIERYLRKLGERTWTRDYGDDTRLSIRAWVKENAPERALLLAAHHWIATEGGLVVCKMYRERVVAAVYPRRRTMVIAAVVWV